MSCAVTFLIHIKSITPSYRIRTSDDLLFYSSLENDPVLIHLKCLEIQVSTATGDFVL